MNESWTTIEVIWNGNLTFQGKNSKGASVALGSAGSLTGISPMELLLIGLAGCTGIDIVSILEKKRVNLQAFKVYTRGTRANEYPRVYKRIEVSYMLWGDNLEPKDVEQAIRLSEEKYCSASAMLGMTAKITSTYQLNPDTQDFPLDGGYISGVFM